MLRTERGDGATWRSIIPSTYTEIHALDNILFRAYLKGMNSVIGERGQITIPKSIRESLGIRPGMKLEIVEENGTIMLRKPGLGQALDKWAETAENPYGTTDAFLNAVRDEDQDS